MALAAIQMAVSIPFSTVKPMIIDKRSVRKIRNLGQDQFRPRQEKIRLWFIWAASTTIVAMLQGKSV